MSVRSSMRAAENDAPRAVLSDVPEARGVADSDAKYGVCTQVFTKVCGVCVRRLIRPFDTQRQREFKTTMLMIWVFALVGLTPSLSLFVSMDEGIIWQACVGLSYSTTTFFLMYSLVTRSVPVGIVEAYVLLSSFISIALDFHNGVKMRDATWPFIIILLDISLLLDLPLRTSYVAVVSVLLCIVFLTLQRTYDFMAFREPLEDYTLPDVCDCARPPCHGNSSLGHELQQGFRIIFVFVLDFYLTRRFAFSAKAEKAAMQSSIDTAQRLATMLSLLDLDTAERILNERRGATTMPPELCRAFGSILQNLRTYKPYLPQSCLPEGLQRVAQVSEDTQDSDAHTERSSASPSQGTPSDSSESLAASGLCRKALTLRQALAEQQKPQWKRVTLVHSNLHNTLLKHESDESCVADGFAQYFASLLTVAVNVCQTQGGVVDLFVGDRVFMSFNTFRHVGRHAHKAASVCKELYEFGSEFAQLNIGVVSGRALCGDGGCEAMRRYSVLGHVSVLAHAYERVGRTLGVAMLCNEQFSGDVRNDHQVRIVPR
eukprot:Rhum_TRINITY_DN15383_c1_g1::Rhum_TRINITY_DN15383_c1_g1_i3::g.153487::m.153487